MEKLLLKLCFFFFGGYLMTLNMVRVGDRMAGEFPTVLQ